MSDIKNKIEAEWGYNHLMEDFRKPPELGGFAKGQKMRCISQCDLGSKLKYVPDPSKNHPGHGYIGPS